MGFLNNLFGNSKEPESAKRRKSLRNRICRIEEVERRELLSASPYVAPDPINVGIVYHEDYYEGLGVDKGDAGGDTFIVAWNGGAGGTTLDKIVINLDKDSAYANSANIHFNIDGTIPNRDGTYYNFDSALAENEGNGILIKSVTVSKDGKTLTIEFDGFTSDKKFFFKIDVDEISGEKVPTVDRLVTGNEMEGATVSGVFSKQDYEDSSFSFKMLDFYSDDMATKLGLPKDAWYTNRDDHDNTAGALGTLDIQTPLRGAISGFVYEDVNNDGIKGAGEKGISGVWLELYFLNEKTGFYESTGRKIQTGADGSYLFDNIEGGRTYKVVETQPDGYADGKDTPGTINGEQVGVSWEPDQLAAIHIGANEHGVDYNFGELKRASIEGYVYHDKNNNGVRETGEEGIANVKLKLQILDATGKYVDVSGAVTRTDAAGHYQFDNLDPFHTYRVVEEQPDGWSDGKESVGTINGVKVGALPTVDDDTIGGILLKYDEHGKDYNFGEFKKGSIGGTVYEDDDNDGKKDPDEKGIPGVEIWLCVVDESGNKVNIKKTVTDKDGNYYFDDLDPGKTYCVTEVQPEEYCDGITTPGTVDGTDRGSVNTDVPAGHDQIHDIYLGSGENGVNYNFGEGQRGSLSGYVYEDTNKNGAKDSGEKGIQGVVLTLWVWDGSKYVQTSKTATTDANGHYEFTGLCPFNKYQIREAQPTNYDDGEETVGSLGGDKSVNDIISDINMPAGGKGSDYNFGELVKPVDPPAKGSLSGYVYVDADKNGTKDSGEVGIGGVTLTLWKLVDGTYVNTGKTTTSNSSGYYIFSDLDPNETYLIAETQPTAYDDGRESVGSLGGTLPATDNDTIRGIFVGPGQHGVNYNFGEWEKSVVPPDPAKGSLSGYVYVDTNKNGVKDSGENGIAGVTLTLWKLVDGSYVNTGKTATTDANGYYVFSNLDPNQTYRIVETQPAAYDDGRESIGTIGGKTVGTLPSVDDDSIYGIVLPESGVGVNYNFGEYVKDNPPDPDKGSLSGYVYADANKNGTKDSGEAGIKDVTLTLWKLVDGTYVNTGTTTKTDSNGYYIFANLDPNQTYMIVETQPTAYDDGEETVGSLGGDKSENDKIKAIVLGAGQNGTNYNFGELEKEIPVDPPTNPTTPALPPIGPYGFRPTGAVGQPGGFSAPTWQTPMIGETLRTGYGGGGLPSGYSWHLSVINAGYPRDTAGPEAVAQGLVASASATQQTMILLDAANNAETDADAKTRYVSVAWTPLPMNQSVWYVRDKNGNVTKKFIFGPDGGIPLVADFNGDGIAELAVFHDGNWYIDLNGNGVWDEEDLWCELGNAADQPIVGDWDGDGKADIGIFGPQWAGDAAIVVDEPGLPSDLNPTVTARPKNVPPSVDVDGSLSHVRAMKHSQSGQVRLDVIDHVFQYGGEGDKAFTGDFSGDGVKKVGVYRNGKWYIDYNGNGQWDDGDIYVDNSEQGVSTKGVPVVGDWNGDGIDKIGVYVDGIWHLDTTGDFKFDTKIEFGEPGDMPVVGDFSGDGVTQLAVYRASSTDSLQTKALPTSAPAVSVGEAAPMYASSAAEPGVTQANPERKVANRFQGDSNENTTDQGTLPEKLQQHERHERTMRTPHSNAPLHRNHRQ